MRAQVPATALYVADRVDADDRVKEALRIATGRRLPLLEVPRSELDRLTGGAVHQGLALQVPPYEYAHPDDLLRRAVDSGQAPLLVALDGVTDPRNLGAVVRSAAAFGAHGVVVPERRSAGMTAGAWKSSAGAAARVPVARATNLTRQLESYRDAGLRHRRARRRRAASTWTTWRSRSTRWCSWSGRRTRGCPGWSSEPATSLVRIPIAASTESLNAGVAAGIVLYEVARRRR